MGYASGSDALALRWFTIGDVGAVFLPAALMPVVASITGRERELRLWIWVCRVLSAMFCVLLFGTDRFVTGLQHFSWGNTTSYGPIGVLFVVYATTLGLVSLVFFYRAYKQSSHPRMRGRLKGFYVSALIGAWGFLDFVPKFGIPLYPIAYLIVDAYLIYMWVVIMRYRLVDITPEVASKQILETMQGAVVVVDLEGRIRVANRTAQEMLGREKGDLLGMELVTLLPGTAALHACAMAGQPATDETVWPGRSGKRQEVTVSASLLTDGSDQSPLGLVYVAHDITKRKRAEEELREANKKLEALDKLKSEFVSVVSHELRTPLTCIKANAELIILKQTLESEKTWKLVRTINDEADRLTRLVNELLDLSRIESGMMEWRMTEVSAADIVRTSIDGILPLVQSKGLELTTLVANMPSLTGDRDRLVQVMTNLLSNAIKFTPSGGRINVEARLDKSPKLQVRISVADTGAGIPTEELKTIFDRFQRSRNELLNRTEGTGLGLTIARQIVERHGGTIWATSRLHEGSIFTFTLPVTRE